VFYISLCALLHRATITNHSSATQIHAECVNQREVAAESQRVLRTIYDALYKSPHPPPLINVKGAASSTHGHVLVVIGDRHCLASRHQLMGHDLSHRVLVIGEGQVKVGDVAVVVLDTQPAADADKYTQFLLNQPASLHAGLGRNQTLKNVTVGLQRRLPRLLDNSRIS